MSDDTTVQASAAPAAANPADGWQRPVWLVPHPTHQYAQDVKALAKLHGLQVVDPAAAGPDELARVASAVPALALRDAQPAPQGQPPAPAKGKKATAQ